MNDFSGMVKPELQDLPQVKDRMTFLYLEHCQIKREDSAIKVIDAEGITLIPSAVISVLLLGPGTAVTHRAIELIGDAGVSLVWVGEKGVRYYASGRPLTTRTKLLLAQAESVVNQRKHLQVVKRMYAIRFPDEDLSHMTLQQLRGKEGARVRRQYKEQAEKWNVEWKRRDYKINDYDDSDDVNKALSAGNVCLYGLAHAVIAALGCSPGLGFIHVGHEKSFVYDLADLYKAETVIPLAFELASKNTPDIGNEMRRKMREVMFEKHILQRMVKDIHKILLGQEESEEDPVSPVIELWDSVRDAVQYGRLYS